MYLNIEDDRLCIDDTTMTTTEIDGMTEGMAQSLVAYFAHLIDSNIAECTQATDINLTRRMEEFGSSIRSTIYKCDHLLVHATYCTSKFVLDDFVKEEMEDVDSPLLTDLAGNIK